MSQIYHLFIYHFVVSNSTIVYYSSGASCQIHYLQVCEIFQYQILDFDQSLIQVHR